MTAARPPYVYARPQGRAALSPARRAVVAVAAVLVEVPALVALLAHLGG